MECILNLMHLHWLPEDLGAHLEPGAAALSVTFPRSQYLPALQFLTAFRTPSSIIFTQGKRTKSSKSFDPLTQKTLKR